MGIIDFYEGDNTYKDARKAKMKALSAKWLTLLNEAHADGNFSGTQFFFMRHCGCGTKTTGPGGIPRDRLLETFYRDKGMSRSFAGQRRVILSKQSSLVGLYK